MRKRKIAIALITALVMALTPMSVLAASVSGNDPITLTDPDDPTVSGNIGGVADITDTLKLDVFKVKVTTLSNTDFVVDPQGFLNKADSDTYKLGKGAVYFGADSTSPEIKFVNLSSMDINVDLKVSATISGNNVKMVEAESDLTDATDPSVYLALSVSGNDADKTAFATTEKSITKKLNRVPDAEVSGNDVSGNETYSQDGYALKTTETESVAQAEGNYATVTPPGGTTKYVYYGLTDAVKVEADADAVSYVLSGKCNSVDAWEQAQNDTVNTNIVWKVTKDGAASEPTTTYGKWFENEGTYISLGEFDLDNENDSSNPGFEDKTKADVSNFKVNGKDCDFDIDHNYDMLYTTDAQVTATGEYEAPTWVFTFTMDGVNYTCTVVYEE